MAAVRAAALYETLLSRKPDAVLGLATGSTPLGLYAQLAALHRAGRLSFARATSFNLDEYVGLPPTHDQSYRYFMEQNLFSKVDLPTARIHVPSGLDVSDAALAGYDAAIEAAGRHRPCSCWAWAATGTSASTSRARRLSWVRMW